VTRRSLPACTRVFTKVQSITMLVLFLFLGGLGSYLAAAPLQQAPVVRGPKIWLGDNQAVPVKTVGSTGLAQSIAAGQAQPLSMATADVDGDGIADLVAGFSAPTGGSIVIHRGNLDAFAPQSNASFQAIGHGQFPSPFLPKAQVINVPVRPDFIALGSFTPSGHQDLVVAARGGNSLYVFSGDGKGGFGTPQILALPGGITALASEKLLRSVPFSNVIVGVATPQTSSLLVFTGSAQGLGSPASFSLEAAATNIVFGDFGDSHTDTAFLAGGKIFVLHSATFQMESIALPVNASAMALGSFIYDRVPGLQIALLTSDGALHIAAHTEFDPRRFTAEEHQARLHAARRGYANPMNLKRSLPQNGWQIVESIASAAPFTAGQLPVLFRTRISDHGADDVMVLNPSMGQLAVISHPDVAAGATTFAPAQISTRPYAGSAVAALPMRTNIDNRPGIVALHQGQLAPAVMMPLPDPTFFVNRTDDPTPGTTAATCNNVSNADVSSSCSLREAVLKANATAGTDTITLAAGTFTLSIARQAGDNTGAHGGLYINDSVNIVGAGQASTIIQGGTSAATGVDLVFAVNEDIQTVTNASASFSNLTIKFGHNRGSVGGTDGDGGCMEYDTGSSGTATLALTNVTLSNCVTQDGNGGGLVVFNFINPGTGQPTISNSIIQNNSVTQAGAGSAGSGGGIWVTDQARMSLSSSTISGNSATQVNGAGRGEGGGIFIEAAGPGERQTVIHGTTISGNSAAGEGGGISTTGLLSVDTASVISGNTAGTDGGGIISNITSPDTVSLSGITITGNTATGNGGGVASEDNGAVTIQFSRLAGNTAATGKNLYNDSGVTITATDNWWGTNTPTTTINNASGTVTSSPFIQFTHTASPTTIQTNASATLTADLSKDNNGSGTALAGHLAVLNGVPVTFNNAVLGTIPQAQPESLNASAQATATFNAGATPGAGHADATVDQQTVTANITIVGPVQITKSFNPTSSSVGTPVTLSFSINNPNSTTVDASFTDTLPTGLVVSATPGVTNTCGGTVTATAGAGSVSFSNASLPAGACTITVKVNATTDGVFVNSVTINSTAAAGSSSSATLTVLAAPAITKAFGASTIPLNGSTSLTFTISNSNATTTLTGLAFTDSLPAGLVVATPSALSTTCNGTATAVAGSSSVSLSGASLVAGASCTVSVNVTGTTAGIKNNSVTVSSTNGGTGNTSNASLTVVGAPVIIKAFGAASIPLNGSTSLSFTIQNNNTTTAATGITFTDTLPAGLVVSTPNGLTGACGAGTITATAGSGTISLSGATIAASSSCTFSVNVTGTTAGTKNNTTGNVTSTEGGTGGTASASVNVVAPPSIAKVFSPTSIALNGTTSLTFTITNPAANAVALTGVAFTDTLPTGLTVANASATVCGGTLTTTAPTGIALSGATMAANSQCQFSVTVTGAAAGSYTNTTGNVTSTNGGTGNTATANLTVATPPSITKAFGASTIPLNGTTSLTFSISNPNTSLALTGLAFTDSLPAGLVVATPSGISNTCSGTATAVAGSSSVSLLAGTLASSASCTVSVNVQGTTAGIKNNSVTVTSTEAGTGNTSNATVTVTGPPVIIKAFGAASIPLNGSTSLSFTIQNNNPTAGATGIAFSDTLPAGLVVSTPNGLTGTCGAGTVTAIAGSGVVSLSGGTIAASSICTFSVNVTGTTAGTKNNTTGNVTSTEGGTGGTASASVNVVAPPSIAKVFNPASIALNATTSLTFTITNPAANAVALTGVAFTDTLPTGLTVANASATVCGGTLTATAPTGIALSGATIAVNSQCQFSVTVTGATAGSFTNTTGNVTSTNGGTGNTATANLSVAQAPQITKTFSPVAVALNGNSTLSFTINNPNTSLSLTGVAFTDSLPAGLVVSTPNALTGTCGGGAITAAAGSSTVSLSGAILAATASCTLSVSVTATTGGVKNNSVTVTANESGVGNTSNATLNVTASPTLVKAFGAATIPLRGTTSLTFTVTNPNPALALTNITFGDTLPTGLSVPTPNGLVNNCTGTVNTGTTSGAFFVSLVGGTLPASGSCSFSINVVGIAAGVQNNTTGHITSAEGGIGGTASATVTVVGPPSIAKAFNPTAIAVNGVSTLTFTLTNPAANPVAEAGVAFTDTLPTGLVVATPNGLVNNCGGTVTATAGSGSISFSGGSIAAASACTVSVNITGTTAGVFNNTSGAVSSTNGGTGNTASASLTIAVADLAIAKTHVGVLRAGQIGAIYTITVRNVGQGPTTGTVTVVDTPPLLMIATAISGTGWTCTLSPLSCNRSDALAPGASYPVITLSTNIGLGISNSFFNKATVSGGGETNTANDTAIDTSLLGPPFSITANNSAATVQAGTAGTFIFDVEESDPSAGTITFGCTGLPVGASCVFNPPSTSAPSTIVSMIVNTSHNGHTSMSARNSGVGRKPPFYAALLFPVFGLVGIAVSGRKNKKNRLRLALLLMGLIALLSFAGCGGTGLQGLNTPAGTYQITVTATSATAQASTPVTLTVQ
jgi:uncharacterized repeat protein (TIGR01451 family)